jgi:curved DNA-binding protein CbpA
VRYSVLSDQELLNLVQSVESLPGIYKVFREGLPDAVAARSGRIQEAVLYLVLKIGLSDSSWIRRNFLNLISNNSQLFELKLEELFKEAVHNEDNLKTEQITKLAAVLFGRQNHVYRKLARFSTSFRDVTEAKRSGSTDRLHDALKQIQEDEEFRGLFGELVVGVFHAQAKQQLKLKDSKNALMILSHLGKELRTPSTFEIIREALRQISPQKEMQSNRSIGKMMQEVASSDPETKDLYLSLIAKQIDLHVHHFHFRKAEDALNLIATLRADPNATNDSLRMRVAHRYVERGSIQDADRLIQDMSSGPGLKDKLILLYHGYYVNRATLFALIVVPLLLFILFYVRRRASLVRTLQSQSFERESFEGLESDEPVERGFSYNVVKRGLSPRMYEYVGLLRTFDLEAEADMKTIKAAYRAAVKSVHPDINPNVTAEEKEKFVQYTSAYEKILDLRRSLGFGVD